MPKTVPRILKRARERRALTPGGGAGQGMSSFLPAPVLSGVAVTPETAYSLTPVFCAINVIATDAASLPLMVLRRSKGGGRSAVTSDPRYNLVYCEPNEDTTSISFRQALLGHALSWGNGYAEVVRDPYDGTPLELQLLSPKPNDTWPDRLADGRRCYRINAGRQTLLAEDVIHIHGLGWDGVSGYSPVAVARQAIGLGLAAEMYGASWFGNGSVPKGILKTPKKLTPEMRGDIRENWEQVHGGVQNGNRVAVLGEGMDWSPISIPPEDAQFLQTRQFQVEEICRLYRLPPHKLSDYKHSHLANVEESNLDYLNTTLGPWLEILEQELNRKLFTSRERAHGLHVNHDTSALLRGNAAARSAIYSQMVPNGAISPDEIRAKEGLNPIPDDAGQTYFYPLNMTKLWSATEGVGGPNEPAASPDTADPGDAIGDGGEDGGDRSEPRFNPNHQKDGKFGSGGGGKGGGGGGGDPGPSRMAHGDDAKYGTNKVAPGDEGAAAKAASVAATGANLHFGSGAPMNKADAQALAAASKKGKEAVRVTDRPRMQVSSISGVQTYHVGGEVSAEVLKSPSGGHIVREHQSATAKIDTPVKSRGTADDKALRVAQRHREALTETTYKATKSAGTFDFAGAATTHPHYDTHVYAVRKGSDA